MYWIIYFILGSYFMKAIIVRLNTEYGKKREVNKVKKTSAINLVLSKTKDILWDNSNIFIFTDKRNKSEENTIIKEKEQWKVKRYEVLEKAKYQCEECGNIANIEVYKKLEVDNEEFIVLCKKCYEKNMAEIKLHYQ